MNLIRENEQRPARFRRSFLGGGGVGKAGKHNLTSWLGTENMHDTFFLTGNVANLPGKSRPWTGGVPGRDSFFLFASAWAGGRKMIRPIAGASPCRIGSYFVAILCISLQAFWIRCKGCK
jgi:hypothetical protein